MQKTQKYYRNVSSFLPICTAAEALSIILMRVQVNFFVGREILSGMGMKSSVFWDITPCTSLDVNRPSSGI
jgi:hypothetical protein